MTGITTIEEEEDRNEPPETYQTVGGNMMGRRQFLRAGTAAAAASAVGVGSTQTAYSPVGRSEAIAPAVAFGLAGGGAAVAYLMNEAADAYLGDEKDYSNYTGGTALHQDIYAGAIDLKSADERVLTSIQNNVTNSENVALTKGKAAIIEEMNAGNSESAANDAMSAAIDDYYSTIQKNLLNHWDAQVGQLHHHIKQVVEHPDIDTSNTIVHDFIDENGDPYNITQYQAQPTWDVTLLNGDTVDVKSTGSVNSGGTLKPPQPPLVPDADMNVSNVDGIRTRAESSSDTSRWTNQQHMSLMSEIQTKRDDVNSQLSGFVNDVYNAYQPGDIPTEEIVDPITASTELKQNYDHFAAQGAHAAMLGISSSADKTVYMHLLDDDDKIWCDIFTDYVPTDDSGNEIGFEVGPTYSPSAWNEPLYVSFEYTDSDGNTVSDFTQIEQDFTIETIEDADGTQVDSFKTESRNNQTSDVQALEEELEQVRKEQIRLQKESESTDGDGGGGGSSDGGSSLLDQSYYGIPVIGWVAGILTALGYFGSKGGS